jgi:hypothetical protein
VIIGRKSTVVINPENGKVITNWRTSQKLIDKLTKP